MKKIFFVLIAVSLFACKKKDEIIIPSDTATPLSFVDITKVDSTLYVNTPAPFIANATGDELTYTWFAEWGTFIGSGSEIRWSACHASSFTINCTVEDKYHQTQTKSIDVKVK
jgi:hypothetical protein